MSRTFGIPHGAHQWISRLKTSVNFVILRLKMAEQISEIEWASSLPHPSGCEQSPCPLAPDIRLKKWAYRRLAHDSNGTVPCVGSAELPACRLWPNSMVTIVKIHNSQLSQSFRLSRRI